MWMTYYVPLWVKSTPWPSSFAVSGPLPVPYPSFDPNKNPSLLHRWPQRFSFSTIQKLPPTLRGNFPLHNKGEGPSLENNDPDTSQLAEAWVQWFPNCS